MKKKGKRDQGKKDTKGNKTKEHKIYFKKIKFEEGFTNINDVLAKCLLKAKDRKQHGRNK